MTTAPRRDLLVRMVAFLLGAACVLLLPALLAQLPLWRADRVVKVEVLLCAAATAAAGIWLTLSRPESVRRSWMLDAVICLAAFVPAGALILLQSQTSRPFPGLPRPLSSHVILLSAIALGVVLVFTVQRLRNVSWVVPAILAVAAAAGGAAQVRLGHITGARIPFKQVVRLNTSLYPLRATFFENALKRLESRGGSLSRLGSGLLLVTGDGDFYQIEHPDTGASLVVHALPFRSPMDRARFGADTSKDGLDVGVRRFRTGSAFVQENGENLRIFVTYHVWNPAERCTVVRLSSIEGKASELLASKSPEWKTWFESKPCLKLEREKEIYFGGISLGGRIAQFNDHELLFTIGDHEFEGVEGVEPLAQEADKTYGKTMLLDLNTGASRIYSTGQRNPEGLYVDSTKRIWATEHGPQGGDELNLIKDGRNYGWPFVTYGVDYGTHAWPINKTNGRHPDFEGPRFAWVPSIATSSVTGVEGNLFDLWKGDLLVGALAGKSIWRVRVVDDDRVTVTEQIPLAHRTRDVIEDQDGRLIVWTDEGAIGVIEPEANPTTPGSLFAWRCSACHALADGTQHRLGPDLYGVVGRGIGKAKGFFYSQALRGKGGSWNEKALDAFLTDPQHFAPGTAMAAPGIADVKERQKVIGYLRSLGREN